MNFLPTVTDILLNPITAGVEQDVTGVSMSKKVIHALAFYPEQLKGILVYALSSLQHFILFHFSLFLKIHSCSYSLYNRLDSEKKDKFGSAANESRKALYGSPQYQF